jgi:hypothetical protein
VDGLIRLATEDFTLVLCQKADSYYGVWPAQYRGLGRKD